jgi:hypothetical protein
LAAERIAGVTASSENAVDLGGGAAVDVLPLFKGVDHHRVAGHVGQHPQLDLGIVGVHQHPAGPGDEGLADLAAQVAAHGDVLQVGSTDEMRPVAAAVWSKRVWMRPSGPCWRISASM